jgi:hypothetical protein
MQPKPPPPPTPTPRVHSPATLAQLAQQQKEKLDQQEERVLSPATLTRQKLEKQAKPE